MAGVATEESGALRLFEGVSRQLLQQQQGCQSVEALAEWRSSEQVENGIPSTSPPYWDSDDDDDGEALLLLNKILELETIYPMRKRKWKQKGSETKKKSLKVFVGILFAKTIFWCSKCQLLYFSSNL